MAKQENCFGLGPDYKTCQTVGIWKLYRSGENKQKGFPAPRRSLPREGRGFGEGADELVVSGLTGPEPWA